MRIENIGIVYRKEFKDLMRDRRTLIGMLLFPLILFPLMTVGIGSISKKVIQKALTDVARIMLLGAEHAPALAAKLRTTQGVEVVPPAEDYKQQISDKKLRAALDLPPGFEEQLRSGAGEPPKLKLYFYTAEIRSESAVDKLEKVVRDYRQEVVAQRLAVRGLPPQFLVPIETKSENVAAAEKVAGLKIGKLIPYFIIILCLMGALHPAMDLTAGEKERGTMETILASGVGRGELVLGKFFLVVTVSLITATLSLTSFGLSTSLSPSYAQELSRGYSFTVSPKAVALVFLLVLPLAVFFSGALLAIAVLARSYKEAQSYTGPLMMVAILPAVASLLPGVELDHFTSLVPIVNVSLVSQEVFTGTFHWGLMAMVFLSSCVYAAIALSVVYWQFHREEVLFRT